MLIVNSCVPTRKTNVSDKVTSALFEKLKQSEKDGHLELPNNALMFFNQKDKTQVEFCCSAIVKLRVHKVEGEFLTMVIEFL